jgi:putative zinc finger protein
MRHIPEEELHAYLDQGLSRSQCVEIESHLAGCPSCQAARDGIAALRDRTTALLAKLAPPRGVPPAFESLRRQAAIEVSARRRRMQIAVWAASLVAAVGLGWTGNYLISTRTPAPVRVSRQAVATGLPTPSVMPAILRPPAPVSNPQPARPIARRQPRRAVAASATVPLPPVIAAPSLELSTIINIPRAELDLELDGMWRTMSWDGAQAEAGDKLPHIDGLPVVQVQLQASEQGKQPLMVVAQQLSSGEVIRTIEGPANDVSHLLARRTMTDPEPSVTTADSNRRSGTTPDHTDRTMAMQRGDRMLVITGALPPDSLLAMIRRLNAEMRSK